MIFNRFGFIAKFLLPLVLLFAQPVFAVSSFETNATRLTDSGPAADPQGPAVVGSLLSEVIVPMSDGGDIGFSGNGYARGAANDSGAGAVGVEGVFFSGGPTLSELTGLAELTSEFTNSGASAVPFSYDFFLPGPRLTLADFAGLAETDVPTIRAFYDFRISLDFGSGFLPRLVSQGELTGGIVSHQLGTAGTNPLASTFFSEAPGNVFGYQFDDLADSISGNVGAGETLRVKTSLFVSLDAPGFETGGAAYIGDPLDLSAAAFSGSLSAVPIPPAVWLLCSSLAALLGFSRREAR